MNYNLTQATVQIFGKSWCGGRSETLTTHSLSVKTCSIALDHLEHFFKVSPTWLQALST